MRRHAPREAARRVSFLSDGRAVARETAEPSAIAARRVRTPFEPPPARQSVGPSVRPSTCDPPVDRATTGACELRVSVSVCVCTRSHGSGETFAATIVGNVVVVVVPHRSARKAPSRPCFKFTSSRAPPPLSTPFLCRSPRRTLHARTDVLVKQQQQQQHRHHHHCRHFQSPFGCRRAHVFSSHCAPPRARAVVVDRVVAVDRSAGRVAPHG